MKTELTKEKVLEITQELDKTITEIPWESSSFLKIIGSRLKKIRDHFLNDSDNYIQNENPFNKSQKDQILKSAERAMQRQIFVSIYNSDGQSLSVWEKIVQNIPRQYITRPIYENEADIKELIKSKINKLNEAYISVYVNKDSFLVIDQEKLPKDKFGKHIILLKDNVIKLENIDKMYHMNEVYQWEKNKLLKV
jgi:intracellular multiplication protein IcmQ